MDGRMDEWVSLLEWTDGSMGHIDLIFCMMTICGGVHEFSQTLYQSAAGHPLAGGRAETLLHKHFKHMDGCPRYKKAPAAAHTASRNEQPPHNLAVRQTVDQL